MERTNNPRPLWNTNRPKEFEVRAWCPDCKDIYPTSQPEKPDCPLCGAEMDVLEAAI